MSFTDGPVAVISPRNSYSHFQSEIRLRSSSNHSVISVRSLSSHSPTQGLCTRSNSGRDLNERKFEDGSRPSIGHSVCVGSNSVIMPPTPSMSRNVSSKSCIEVSYRLDQIYGTQNPYSKTDNIDKTPNQLSALLVHGYCRGCDSIPMDVIRLLWLYYRMKAPVFNVYIAPDTIQLFPPSYFNTEPDEFRNISMNQCIRNCINGSVDVDIQSADTEDTRSLDNMLEAADNPKCIQLLQNMEYLEEDAVIYRPDIKKLKIVSFAVFPEVNLKTAGTINWHNVDQNMKKLNEFTDAVVIIDMGQMTQNYGGNEDGMVDAIETGIKDIASVFEANDNIFYDINNKSYASYETYLDGLYLEDIKSEEDEPLRTQYLAYSGVSVGDRGAHSIMSDLRSKKSRFVDYDIDFKRRSDLSSLIVCNNMDQDLKEYILQAHADNDQFGDKCLMTWVDGKDPKSDQSVSMIVSDNGIYNQYHQNIGNFLIRDN